MNRLAVALFCQFLAWTSMATNLPAEEARKLDDFKDIASWKAAPADGVEMELAQAPGSQGRGLRIDFDFQGHGGWASTVRPLELELPENFAIEFDIRGQAPVNNLEIKLIDDTGENVWWTPHQQFNFPEQWTRLRIKRRHFRRAWGPNPERPLNKISALEITVAAGSGGKGSLWIDELSIEPLEPDLPYDLEPQVRCSSVVGSDQPSAIFQDKRVDGWRSAPDDHNPWLVVDFARRREFGGLILDWDGKDFASDYRISFSNDGENWKTVFTVQNGNGDRDYLPLRESETRFLRIDVEKPSGGNGVELLHLEVAPLEFGESPNSLFQRIAHDAPPGKFPKHLTGEQSFWTVVGVDGAAEEALINEQGMVELQKGSFSVEPFLKVGERVLTWHDATCQPSLEEAYLPIPSVTWHSSPVNLRVTALAVGEPQDSALYVRYLLNNHSDQPQRGALLLALRPFQVNPPWQFLGTRGGVSPIRQIEFDEAMVTVNGEKQVATVPAAVNHFAATFAEGGAWAAMRNGTGQGRNLLRDETGYAAGVLEFPFEIDAGDQQSICLVAPFNSQTWLANSEGWTVNFQQVLEAATAQWKGKLGALELKLPPSQQQIANTLQTTLAYILINRDGAGIQPGSRSYERSWIRDGALTSSALLRLGQFEVVRDFLRWYAPYQFDSGKVPCCVDQRGADSVPEHDSHGQLIYAIAEYHRFTHDDKLLRELWPHVQAAVEYIRKLRRQRMTEQYQSEDKRAFYGLMPESISHEGYSAKPMHSYWDDFFVLRGLKDAVYVAQQLDEKEAARQYAELRNAFRRDLLASLAVTMERHEIDYLPGCVELGDFDATSSTIIVSPCDETNSVPRAALDQTFDKYWSEFVARRDGTREWDAYTPYEWRVVGTLVRLGYKQRAHEAVDFFFQHRRPAEWNHWGEIVYPDRATAKFIGDMPHTWVGSDFIRSFLDMFAYDRESDETLVVGAGIPERWLSESAEVSVRGLHTYGGELELAWTVSEGKVSIKLSGLARVPPGGIHVLWPLSGPCRAAALDEEPVDLVDGTHVIVRELPVVVDFMD